MANSNTNVLYVKAVTSTAVNNGKEMERNSPDPLIKLLNFESCSAARNYINFVKCHPWQILNYLGLCVNSTYIIQLISVFEEDE